MLPTVDFCGLGVTRLVLGANPFGGYSHQSKERDQAMLAHSTPERIIETWQRAEAAGINTMVTNHEAEHILSAISRYFAAGGKLQWIVQISLNQAKPDMLRSIDEAVARGCKAIYFHGGIVDDLYAKGDGDSVRRWCDHARARGVPAGVAAHAPEVHLWADSLNTTDFHAVCFFNCGSLHTGKGHRFSLRDVPPAAECVRRLRKPCIAYKVMGAGRIDPRMGLEYAFESIKPGDVVNVGMFRGDKDDMVEQNASLVRDILAQ